MTASGEVLRALDRHDFSSDGIDVGFIQYEFFARPELLRTRPTVHYLRDALASVTLTTR